MKIVIVLGNRLNDDGSMSNILLKRLNITLDYCQKTNPNYIIVSGGIANDKIMISEANRMKDYLIKKGINSTKIIEEDRSMTTYENAIFSSKIINSIIEESTSLEITIISTIEHFTEVPYNTVKFFKDSLDSYSISYNLLIYTKSND